MISVKRTLKTFYCAKHPCGLLKDLEITEMTVKTQNLPSFASIISVLSIVLYCLGSLRVELELNEQRKRLKALENVAEIKPSNHPHVTKLIKNAPGKFVLESTLEAFNN